MTQKELKLYNLLGDSRDKIVEKSPNNFNTLRNIYDSGFASGKISACLIVREYLSGNIDSKEFIKLMIKS